LITWWSSSSTVAKCGVLTHAWYPFLPRTPPIKLCLLFELLLLLLLLLLHVNIHLPMSNRLL
jgi:hypothetical protein